MKTKLLSLLITLVLISGFLPVPVQAQVSNDDIKTAIDDGVAWLAEQQNMDSTSPDYGSWGIYYPVGETGLAVLKLEEYAFEQGKSPFDDSYLYKQKVEDGLNYLFKHAHIAPLSSQGHDNTWDDNADDGVIKGVYFMTATGTENYETGICMMAIAASRCPCEEVTVTDNEGNVIDSDLNGKTYREVLCDAVNYLAFGQRDSGTGRGGWGYYANDDNINIDNSNSGYVVTGLQFAEDHRYCFSCTIPDFVKSELKHWIAYIQSKNSDPMYFGGSGYKKPIGEINLTNVTINTLKTGNLLSEMAFVDYTQSTLIQGTPIVKNALTFISNHWYSETNDPGWGWSVNPANYQAAYCLMKGLQSMGLSTIQANDQGIVKTVDWYQDLADVIVSQQNVNLGQPEYGSWPDTSPMEVTSGVETPAGSVLSTVWALLALERAAPSLPSCECQGWNHVTVSWTGSPPGTLTGKCDDKLTIPSVSPNTEIKVSTSENCTFGCAASENWTVTSSKGLIAHGDGATATFPPAGSDTYTVAFNATCGRGSDNISCPDNCDNTYCDSSSSDNVSCSPCTIVIAIGNPTVSAGDPQQVCQDGTVNLIGGNPTDGTWSGTGVTGTTFNAQDLAPGEYQVTYSYPDPATGSSSSATKTVTVNPKPVASATVVKKPSVCPQVWTLTGKPDNMMTYKWTDSSGSTISNKKSFDLDTTNWLKKTYTLYLTVTDYNKCTDTVPVTLTVGFEPCSQQGCNCTPPWIWFPPQYKCSSVPCGCAYNIFEMYCKSTTKPPSPCDPPVINNVSVIWPPGPPCKPGEKLGLSWDVDVPYTQMAWPDGGTSTNPVYIEFKCTDSNNNVQTYWGPEHFEQDGSLTYTLPAYFLPCGQKCQFCVWSYDCHKNKVEKCVTICDNVTVHWQCPQSECTCLENEDAKKAGYLVQCATGWCWKDVQPCKQAYCGCDKQSNPAHCVELCDNATANGICPKNCECRYGYFGYTIEPQLCMPCPCDYDANNIPKYCFPISKGPEPPPAPTPCPENCDCLTEKEALDLGYTTLRQQEPCSAPGEPQKFCYSRCPEGCSCVTEKEADEQGYTISCGDEICDPTSKEAKYCFSPPLQPCSQRCQCLTQAQAKEYGYSDAQRCQTTPCKQDAQGKDMYCYPKPKAPVVDVTADRSFVTQGDPVKVCWRVAGEGITEVLFSAAGEKPTPVDPQGCKTFKPTQQTRYLVTAKSPAGSGQDSVTVGVGQPPPVGDGQPPPVGDGQPPPPVEVCPTINSFTANCPPPTGGVGKTTAWYAVAPCTASWSVTGPAGTTVSISDIGAVGLSGSTQVQQGATYVLTARYGTCTRTASVQVQVPPQ